MGLFKEKLKAHAPWPPSAPIDEPVGYNITFEVAEEAAKTFGWKAAIRTVKDKIRETRALIDERRAEIKTYRGLAIIVLVPQLRFAEAVDAVFAAYDLDPASPEIGNEIVWVRNCCGQYAEAAEQARRIVKLHPAFLEAYWSLAAAECSSGEHAAASAALDRAEHLGPEVPFTLALRCFVEGARGNLEAVRQTLARLDSLQDPAAARAIYRAWAYAATGDLDRGMQYLERAVDAADPHALYVEVFPPNAPLRAHPRYPEILRRQRLPRLGAQPARHGRQEGEPSLCL